MYQHPIPQNVTAYEFHLIGNMTIKQFIELGVGIGVAVLFYSIGLPSFIKWPLIIISVIIGFALAFMPFDGRPLDRMVIIFFKAVYAPTQYIWRKDPQIPSYFNYTTKKVKVDEVAVERQRLRKNIGEYLETLPDSNPYGSDISENEAKFAQNVAQLFSQSSVSPQHMVSGDVNPGFHQETKPRVRAMKPEAEVTAHIGAVPEGVGSAVVHVPDVEEVSVVTTPQVQQTSSAEVPVDEYGQPIMDVNYQQPDRSFTQTTQAPQAQALAFPTVPTEKNLLVGMVLDSNRTMVENAIVEVRNAKGQPISAMKTNSLGQFFAASKLKKGDYNIVIEKQGLQFDVYSITLKNQVVQPLELVAKA